MKRIPLPRGMFAVVDDRDYDRLRRHRWRLRKGKQTFYPDWQGPLRRGKRTRVLMHQEIMGRRAGFEIDHRNGNGLDNRRCNLRWATNAQNQANRKGYGWIGYKGVTLQKNGTFQARISVKKRSISLGVISESGGSSTSLQRGCKAFLWRIRMAE